MSQSATQIMSYIDKPLGLPFILFFFLSGIVQAQFYETIRSGRPGQSIGVSTVGQGIFQVQSGVDHFGYTNHNTDIKDSGFLTNTALRFGLTETFEVATFFEYKTESITDNNITYSQSGLSNMVIALRYQIVKGKGILPSIGFQFRMRMPALSKPYQIDNIAPSFVFVTSQQLSKSFTLITNFGSSWNGNDATPTGLYTVNLSCAFTDTFGAFVENYGSITQGVFETRFDSGIAWLATDNLQLDLFGGLGNNNGIKDYLISAGFSWRIVKQKTRS